MSEAQPWRPGVIEGFFGQAWSWEARTHYAEFLAQQGFASYIYAPKSDSCLRKQWQQSWPQDQFAALQQLSQTCQEKSVNFGIGLSPFELYLDFSPRRKEDLRRKLEEINVIAPGILCILFDDMTGALSSLASKQLEIMEFVTTHSTAKYFMLCPTYYSSDPRLAKLFGPAPQTYLEELGQSLDQQIAMFWTGPQIISHEYPAPHLLQVSEQMRRKPVLWDNYPVNDAQKLTNYLHLQPFTNRDPELQDLCGGLFANPMNQAYLSQLPLYSLPRALAGHPNTSAMLKAACTVLCPSDLSSALQEDASLFQQQGLEKLDSKTKAALVNKYKALTQHPMTTEVLHWLQGAYAFDPNCLT